MTKDKTVTMSRELAERAEQLLRPSVNPPKICNGSYDEGEKQSREAADEIYLLLAAPVVERQLVAWRHTMHYEGGGYSFKLTDSAKSPFGKPDVDYDKSFSVTCEPLFTSPPAPVAVPTFKGYQQHIVRELQAAFSQACEIAGIAVVKELNQ